MHTNQRTFKSRMIERVLIVLVCLGNTDTLPFFSSTYTMHALHSLRLFDTVHFHKLHNN